MTKLCFVRLTFFLRRGVPLPPIRTWACSFLSFSGFMLQLSCRASRNEKRRAADGLLEEKSPNRFLERAERVVCAATGDEARVPRIRREAQENGSVRFLARPTTSELTSGVAALPAAKNSHSAQNTASADDRKSHSVRNHSKMTFKKSRNINDARISEEFQSITLLARQLNTRASIKCM